MVSFGSPRFTVGYPQSTWVANRDKWGIPRDQRLYPPVIFFGSPHGQRGLPPVMNLGKPISNLAMDKQALVINFGIPHDQLV